MYIIIEQLYSMFYLKKYKLCFDTVFLGLSTYNISENKNILSHT